MRSFYPPRKKGHSYRHFVKPSAARHSVTVSGRPATMGRNSIRHGRICSHLKDCRGLPSIDFVFRKPCLVSKLRIRAAAWSTGNCVTNRRGPVRYNLQE